MDYNDWPKCEQCEKPMKYRFHGVAGTQGEWYCPCKEALFRVIRRVE